MNEVTALALILLAETVLVGGLLLIQPYITRRGLLFGVYVGEERWATPEPARITRGWTLQMLLLMAASNAAGLVTFLLRGGTFDGVALAFLVATILTTIGSTALYLVAHAKARSLAAPGAPAAVAALIAEPANSLAFPLVALAVAAISGGIALAYAIAHYSEMPAQVPTHFGFAGTPDAWSPKSYGSVLMLPFGSLFMGVAISVIAALTARAKRAIRAGDRGVSLGAQMQFRHAVATFLSGTAILVSLMMSSMAIYSVRTALGLASGIPAVSMALTLLVLLWAIGGSVFLAARYGQGGSRLEAAATAPLSNGLADNSHWVLGMFYVNRDDPSFMVEKRFGIGYTINFGNPKAVALLAVFFLVILLIVYSGVTMPQTTSGPVQ